MKKQVLMGVGVVVIGCAAWCNATLRASSSRSRAEFESLKMHIEVDLQPLGSAHAPTRSPLDLPAEIVVEASSPSRLASIRVMDSARRVLLRVDCPIAKTLGVSDLELGYEGTLRDVLREYPAGYYAIEATTVDGQSLSGTARLQDRFPGLFSVVAPQPDQLVALDDVVIAWTPARGAVRYTLEIEHDASGFSLEVTLPPSQTSFPLPGSMLRPGEAYEYSLAVQGDTDNELELEGRFVTAPAHHVPRVRRPH